ncbi:uncharacterized protein LOC124272429 [Haliotis rubra]|uniref:uncharacterized protein LOC124272429 n=1 Tax=Haliotis rubra TaxID=36100 RepID=UPI001EE59A27|nr:uncharacterized protein LOC124272429 [Haliotis rubra]
MTGKVQLWRSSLCGHNTGYPHHPGHMNTGVKTLLVLVTFWMTCLVWYLCKQGHISIEIHSSHQKGKDLTFFASVIMQQHYNDGKLIIDASDLVGRIDHPDVTPPHDVRDDVGRDDHPDITAPPSNDGNDAVDQRLK